MNLTSFIKNRKAKTPNNSILFENLFKTLFYQYLIEFFVESLPLRKTSSHFQLASFNPTLPHFSISDRIHPSFSSSSSASHYLSSFANWKELNVRKRALCTLKACSGSYHCAHIHTRCALTRRQARLYTRTLAIFHFASARACTGYYPLFPLIPRTSSSIIFPDALSRPPPNLAPVRAVCIYMAMVENDTRHAYTCTYTICVKNWFLLDGGSFVGEWSTHKKKHKITSWSTTERRQDDETNWDRCVMLLRIFLS